MKRIILCCLFATLPTYASVIGISTHPLSEEARVLSAEMTGYMSQRHEMGAGLRYTHELKEGRLLDASVSGGQDSRGFTMGSGLDLQVLREDINQPRISFKPFWQHQKFDDQSFTVMGAAPTMRKGVVVLSTEVFPYLALPNGLKIDNKTDELVFTSAITFGASFPFPGTKDERVLLSFEGNKDLGASSDYVGALVSWMWK